MYWTLYMWAAWSGGFILSASWRFVFGFASVCGTGLHLSLSAVSWYFSGCSIGSLVMSQCPGSGMRFPSSLLSIFVCSPCLALKGSVLTPLLCAGYRGGKSHRGMDFPRFFFVLQLGFFYHNFSEGMSVCCLPASSRIGDRPLVPSCSAVSSGCVGSSMEIGSFGASRWVPLW